MARYLTDAQRNEIVRLYRAGMGTTELAEMFGKASINIGKTLLRAGETLPPRYKHTCDHRFFQTIDAEHKAYWLGFLGADGYVMTSPRNIMVLELSRKDETHLIAFKRVLLSTHPLFVREGSGPGPQGSTVAFRVWGSIMVDDLIRQGVHPRKTHTLQWPSGLPDDMARHYLRGYFDGDGCWYNPAHKPVDVAWILSGNKPFLEGCKSFLKSRLDLGNPGVRKCEGAVHELRFTGRHQCKTLFHFMYNDAHVYLPRKYDKVANRFTTT